MGTPVHRVVPDFVIQMGDVMNKDGTGGEYFVSSLIKQTKVSKNLSCILTADVVQLQSGLRLSVIAIHFYRIEQGLQKLFGVAFF